jgi:hypothetical protein
LSDDMMSVNYMSHDYEIYDAMYEVYDHLITKFVKDYR